VPGTAWGLPPEAAGGARHRLGDAAGTALEAAAENGARHQKTKQNAGGCSICGMRKKRDFIPGVAYHVTSRTNNKIRTFECNLGRKVMVLTLQGAKDKFGFKLHNFCVMPTHIHLLMTPSVLSNMSDIMHWIKTQSSKRWNFIHGSTDHLWGARFFARAIGDMRDYSNVYNYIDRNAVKAGLVLRPQDWKASGAFYIAKNISGLVDYTPFDRLNYIKLLPPP